MDNLIVIPARYQSSRFPGKPLVSIRGKSLLQRVWERCIPVLGSDAVVVATDDQRIVDHCEEHGMRWVMTPDSCLTGTDRIAAAAQALPAQRYINVQGDEPLVEPADIEKVIAAANRYPGEVINAVCAIGNDDDFRSVNVPKVVFAADGRLLYMSRAAIPGNKSLAFRRGWKQVCIYAFDQAALQAFASCESKTPLEHDEDIEILRFLELGIAVRIIEVASGSVAVDVPADVARVEAALDA